MSSKPIIFIKDKIWTPFSAVNVDDVKEAYTKSFYYDAACQKCEYRPDRHSSMCDECEAYQGTTKLFARKVVRGVEYIGTPIGDKRNYERKTGLLFEEVKIVDKRILAPFDYKIKFIIDLYDYQQQMVDAWLKKKYGLMEAPPRTGKTACLLYVCLELGQRTLIMASQHEFLNQFLDHIHGNVKEGIPKCTNLPELERKYKKKLYGFPKTDEDFENFQFFTATYQQYLSETRGRDRFNRIAKLVGTVGVDEVHKSSAFHFARIVSQFPSRYRLGVTATVNRKDGRHILTKNIIGPIVAKSARESMTPTVWVHETEFYPKSKYNSGKNSWTFAMLALSKDKKRNKMIVDWVMRDLKAGHNIVIPVYFKKHVLELQRLINERWDDLYPGKRRICEVFMGGGGAKNKDSRKEILTLAKLNKVRVIVGIRSLLQLGLNVPSWSCIEEVMPISNEPNLKQETSRVRTPVVGKKTPIVRFFIDMQLGQSAGCGRNSIRHCMGFKYNFAKTDEQKKRVHDILNSGRSRMTEAEMEQMEYKAVRTLGKAPPTKLGLGVKRL